MPSHGECECFVHVTFTVDRTVYEEVRCPVCSTKRIYQQDSRYHYTCNGLAILKSSKKAFDPRRPFGGLS